MFDLAYKKACGFIEPIIILSKLENENPEYNIQTAILINKDGYFLAPGHTFKQYSSLREKIGSRENSNDQFEFRLGKCNGHILWFTIFDEILDLGVGKFSTPFQSKEYPILREARVVEGEFLCRVGFPFIADFISYRDGRFEVNYDAFDPYVNQALVSQVIVCIDNVPELRFLETNPSGFPGHSGAPLLDKDGNICGVHTNTQFREMNRILRSGRTWNQILSSGWAVDISTVISFLDKEGI